MNAHYLRIGTWQPVLPVSFDGDDIGIAVVILSEDTSQFSRSLTEAKPVGG